MTTRWILRYFIPGCSIAVTAWFLLLITLTWMFEPVKEVVILGPESRLLVAIKNTEVKILSGSAPYIVVRGTRTGFVGRLYSNGAWIVLPGSVSGCLNPENWKISKKAV